MAKVLAILLVFMCFALPAFAADAAFSSWLSGVEQEAIAAGVSAHVAREALMGLEVDSDVIDLDRKQPEKTVTFDRYVSRVVSTSRVAKGRRLYEENAVALNAIAQRYGVPPWIILALWGVESSYGASMGDYSVISSLATLAYEGRRSAFFRQELIAALQILERERIPAQQLVGSWAGAMGQCQFMPTTYLRHAVDFQQKGKRDIWANEDDVWASIANYIAAEGWDAHLTWGREVELRYEIPASQVGLDVRHDLATWAQMGVRAVDGSALPQKDLEASLIQPDGADGRSFLVYDNFRALMRWNRSTYFATSVGLLADRIKQ